MLFHRLDFFLFFVVVLAIYAGLRHRAQNLWLLAASYVFYAGWDWRFSGLMLGSTLVDFAAGWAMGAGRSRRFCLAASVFTHLSVLGVFKYANFFLDSLQRLLGVFGVETLYPSLSIVLPVGVSFYTFQSMSYTIDVYRGTLTPCLPVAEGPGRAAWLRGAVRAFTDFALYVAFFPQLVAGPIERAAALLSQVTTPRRITVRGLLDGAWLFLLGLVMKIAIADPLAGQVDRVYSNPSAFDLVSLYVATVCFALQVYCDFGGYSNMARGLASMMGFELQVNFRQPYLARSFTDFWRRWHVSFSTWIRDYVYIPLGGSHVPGRRAYANLLFAMVVSGLWHGATWAFAAWGAVHGVFLALERALAPRRPTWLAGVHVTLVQRLVVLHGVLLGWFLFRVGDLGAFTTQVDRMFHEGARQLATSVPTEVWQLVPLVNFGLLFLVYEIPCWRADRTLQPRDLSGPHRLGTYLLLALALLSSGGAADEAFIYFQF